MAPQHICETVCCQSFAWEMRQQPPMEHGTTDSQVVLSLRLTEAEMGRVVLDPKEYDESKWLEPDAILAGPFHPALKFAVSSLLGVRKLRALQAAVAASPADDAAIATLAREFCTLAAASSPPAGRSEYRVVAPALGYECDVTTALC